MFIEDRAKARRIAAAAEVAEAAQAAGVAVGADAVVLPPAFDDSYSAMGPVMTYVPKKKAAKKT
ncbi:hypothetical protein HK405_002057, partial [Cladochytrium tenue]